MSNDRDDLHHLSALQREVSDLSGEFRVYGYRLGVVEQDVLRRAPVEDVGRLESLLADLRADLSADRQRIEAAARAIEDERARREDAHRDKDRRADLTAKLFPAVWATIGAIITALAIKYLGLVIP